MAAYKSFSCRLMRPLVFDTSTLLLLLLPGVTPLTADEVSIGRFFVIVMLLTGSAVLGLLDVDDESAAGESADDDDEPVAFFSCLSNFCMMTSSRFCDCCWLVNAPLATPVCESRPPAPLGVLAVADVGVVS